jgi:mRNA interferase MazF
VKRGEIRWYKFHLPDKKCPVLILTRDSVIGYLAETTVVPITTTIRDIPSELILSKEDGMPKDCALNCDHLQTVAKAKIGSLITTLSPNKMSQVSQAVRFALNL